MIKISFAVCDDDEIVCEAVYDRVKAIFEKCGIECEAEKYTSPVELGTFLANDKRHYDLLFLDIDMPRINGINLAKVAKKKSGDNTDIIFVSNREDRVFEALGVQPFGFVRKGNFVGDLKDVLRSYLNKKVLSKNYFAVRTNNNSVAQKVCVNDIVYIESFRYNQIIYLVNGEKLEIRMTMEELEEKLKQYSIIRIYKSFLVNLKYVQRIERDGVKVQYDDGVFLNISRRHVQEIKAIYLDYLRKSGAVSFDE